MSLRPHLHGAAMVVTLLRAVGSTPREAGVRMLVTPDTTHGTIGGGAYEQAAIHRARALWPDGQAEWDCALGPEMDQCCGGRVWLRVEPLTPALAAAIAAAEQKAERAQPTIAIFGAGHVGLALARALSLLPFQVVLIDERDGALAQAPMGTTTQLHALPEAAIARLPAGSAVVILTPSHERDYALTALALRRHDLSYVGLIGSESKRALFRRRFLAEGGLPTEFDRLTCPIGGRSRSKEPAVIAALTAAELIRIMEGEHARNTDG